MDVKLPTTVGDNLAINASDMEVAAILSSVVYNKNEISEFVEKLGPQDTLAFCAFFIGSMSLEVHNLPMAFASMLNTAIQVAGQLAVQYDKEHPGEPHTEGEMRLIFPDIPDPTAEATAIPQSDGSGPILPWN